jgi:hypothetical protein
MLHRKSIRKGRKKRIPMANLDLDYDKKKMRRPFSN